MADALSLGEDLAEIFRSEDISQGGLSQEASGAVSILHVGDGYRGILYAVIHDSIHGNRHGVFGEDLETAAEGGSYIII